MILAIVWSPAAILAAIAGGLGIGYLVVGAIGQNPLYSAGLASPGQVARLVAVSALVSGVVFFVGQATATWADGDPNWPRVVSRLGVWIVYGVAIAIGTFVRLNAQARERKARLLERARRELQERPK